MADERSVDMGESSPTPPAAGSQSATGLTPERQAYSDFVLHSLQCTPCQDIAEGPCVTGEELWQAWRRIRRGGTTAVQ